MRGNSNWKTLSGITIFGLALGLALIPQEAPSRMSEDPGQPQSPVDDLPAYHAQAPKGGLPATIDPALFTDPVVQKRLCCRCKNQEGALPAAVLLPLRP